MVHSVTDSKKRKKIVIQSQGKGEEAETREYPINYGSKLRVEDGDTVAAGDEMIEGSITPHDLLRILGVKAVQDYIVKEVQSTYRRQGVEIADKHIEVIVRQMPVSYTHLACCRKRICHSSRTARRWISF